MHSWFPVHRYLLSGAGVKADSSNLNELDVDADDYKKSRPVAKHWLNNIIIQLQKAVNHPTLMRAFYSDEQIEAIARVMQAEEKEYAGVELRLVLEDMHINSDFELHRLCTAHPQLQQLRLSDEQLFESAGKFRHLKTLLSELHAGGHRVLLFSQMTRMLDILEAFMTHLGYEFLRLDGATPVTERLALIDTFNEEKRYFVFLLSTRAGGLGINLTAADTVIFYDTSFNPRKRTSVNGGFLCF